MSKDFTLVLWQRDKNGKPLRQIEKSFENGNDMWEFWQQNRPPIKKKKKSDTSNKRNRGRRGKTVDKSKDKATDN